MDSEEREGMVARADTSSPGDTGHAGYGRSSIREQTARARQAVREKGAELEQAVERKSGELRDAAMRRTDELTSSIGGRIDTFARALYRACDELRNEGQPALADVTGDAAGAVQRVGAYMDGRSSQEMISDLERTARTHPAYFVGGTFALGLLIGRFLKADQPETTEPFEPYGADRVDPELEEVAR